ncbi:porin [Paraburkholderia sp. ZP32-5]|uniref:porin n=1 Tax=Paraburkholderia sp. ZP32-5 TaxID=2883245 RepID=UPI001F15FBBA|nr:porin [Paraburkholderia sp. ZP32-5]
MRWIAQGIGGAALLLAAGVAAAADSSVTLYGVADSFIQYLDNGGAHSASVRSGGATGSLFGLTGTEDLGGGLNAKFDLEGEFNINNGSLYANTTALFYRQAWMGLIDAKLGSLTFGRQYEPSFVIAYPADPFRLNENLSLASANVLAVDRNTLSTQSDSGRANNAILYQSPDLRGVRLYGMYSFSGTVTQPVPMTNGNALALAASYRGYGLYAGLAYTNQQSGQATIAGLRGPLDLLATEHFVAALAYQIGITNLQFIYTYVRADDAPAKSLAALVGTAHSYGMVQLGATIQVTPADAIMLAASQRDVRGAHDNAVGFEVGAEHALSRRTSLYMRAGYIKNNGDSVVSWPGIVVSEFATKQVLAAVGMTYRF